MDCGVPLPQRILMRKCDTEFNDAVYHGQWKEAYAQPSIIIPDLPGICPDCPCESACVLGINQHAPVAIEEMKNTL
jgi:NADPH-dependent glutamate synthase beta subunit-like oxidoreductase